MSDLAVEGRGIHWDKQVPSKEALESILAELKLYGKRAVYNDTKLQERGGEIFERDGICITLVTIPDDNLHLYYNRGRVGDDPNVEEQLKEWENVDNAVKRFDDSVDARHGGLGLRQLGVAAVHCKLEPLAAAVFETVRDITDASHLIGDMTGATVDAPLLDRYNKLNCKVLPLEKESDDYNMIVNYMEKTYEPVKVGEISYGVSVENIFAVESTAAPSYDEIKELPNKVLLWCVPGYMFGKVIVCSGAAAEAARYGFTAVDRLEGFLALAIASLGDQVLEVKNPPEDTKSLEEKKDNIKVPCGRLIPSEHKDSPLEYNEYAAFNPKQTSIRFVVRVKYEEQGVEMGAEEEITDGDENAVPFFLGRPNRWAWRPPWCSGTIFLGANAHAQQSTESVPARNTRGEGVWNLRLHANAGRAHAIADLPSLQIARSEMAEEHRLQAQQLCDNNCGFFGSPTTQNLCSKCYRDLQLKERRSSTAKLALDQTSAPAPVPAPASAASISAAPAAAISAAPAAAPSPPAAGGSEAAPAAAAAGPSRCAACRRRVGLTGFRCRCGVTFCGSHRYPEQHGCDFDFKAMGREQISKANPVVVAEKLEKI
ncbi:hypothetical protein NL676_004716 [Syzygium grande]|nr:hypothetical protein NL676_004716 [Syzygium grande]